MAYSKLHSSIVNSSLWTEPDAVRILFITLLAMCDRDGIVYGTKLGLTRLANIDRDEADHAWESLMSEDTDSSDKMRAPENEGRRIEEVPGGFRLLNFEYYRGLRNDDDRREQNRQSQARFKAKSAKVSQDKPSSASISQGNPISEAEAEAEVHKGGATPKDSRMPSTEIQAVHQADMVGVPQKFAKQVFNDMEATVWQDGAGRPITNWSIYIKARWNKEQDKKNRPRRDNRGSGGETPMTFMP